jgi:hypothetical protein
VMRYFPSYMLSESLEFFPRYAHFFMCLKLIFAILED